MRATVLKLNLELTDRVIKATTGGDSEDDSPEQV